MPEQKGIQEDATKELELRSAEEAFRRLRKAVETVQIGVTITDTEGRIVFSNPAEARMHGYTVQELTGKHVRIFAPSGHGRPMTFDQLKDVRSWRRESLNVRKDGTLFPVQLMSDVVTNSAGEAIGIVTTCEDITERKKAEEAIEFRVRFEKLVSGFSSRFINLSPREVDKEINQALAAIGSFDGDDRSYVFQFHDRGTRFTNTHEWCRTGIESQIQRLRNLSIDDLPWVAERLFRGETVHIPVVADLPIEASSEKQEFMKEKIQSLLNIPMIVGGNVVGFVGFDSVRQQKMWSEDSIALLKIVGEIFASALERKRVDSAMRKAKEELEHRVERRTQQLAEMNRILEEGIKVRNLEIFERRRAEQALKESEERYRDILENATDLILSVAPGGEFVFVNRAWRETLGYYEGDMAHMVLFDVVVPEQRDRCREIFGRATKGEGVEKFETEFVSHGGSRMFVEGSISCRFEDGKPVSVRCIFRDITHRKEIERMKNEFIATVSHELRTPLTAIHGSLGVIASGMGGEVSPKVKTLTEIARKNSARLIRMINDFLDVEKIESGRMEFVMRPQELLPLVETSIEANRPFADKFGVRLVLKEPPPGVMVNVDGDRLIQVITNLLSNAAKFSLAESEVTISVQRIGPSVRLSVQDHGSGIPEEFRSRMFQRFAQARGKETKGGTGLGLSISKAIIEKFGGKVGFETELNAGSTFFFELPEWVPESN